MTDVNPLAEPAASDSPSQERQALEALRAKPAWSRPADEWYVDRGLEFGDEILAEIHGGRERGVTWVTASAGGGLSSELARLAQRLTEAGWLAVRVSMLSRAEPGRDLSATPGLLITAFWLLRALPDASASARLEHWFEQRVIRITERLREMSLIPAPRGRVEWVNALGRYLHLTIARMRDADFRAELEADPALRPAECAELVAGLVGVLESETGKRAVLLLEDTNEIDQCLAADRLITRCISLWQSLPARIVMAYPRRLDYAEDFLFGIGRDPRFELRADEEQNAEQFLADMLRRRVAPLELSDSLLRDVFAATLGNPGEAVRLLADALALSVARGQPLAPEHFAVARERRGVSLRRVAGSQEFRRLLEIERSGEVEAQAARWFGARILLETGDAGRARVHPALLDLIPVE